MWYALMFYLGYKIAGSGGDGLEVVKRVTYVEPGPIPFGNGFLWMGFLLIMIPSIMAAFCAFFFAITGPYNWEQRRWCLGPWVLSVAYVILFARVYIWAMTLTS